MQKANKIEWKCVVVKQWCTCWCSFFFLLYAFCWCSWQWKALHKPDEAMRGYGGRLQSSEISIGTKILPHVAEKPQEDAYLFKRSWGVGDLCFQVSFSHKMTFELGTVPESFQTLIFLQRGKGNSKWNAKHQTETSKHHQTIKDHKVKIRWRILILLQRSEYWCSSRYLQELDSQVPKILTKVFFWFVSALPI